MPENSTLLLLLAAAAYAVGSIPFGLLIGLRLGVDIREHGSGNIGATNAWRVLGRKVGITCFVLDLLKGLLPSLAAGFIIGAAGRLDLSPTQALGWIAVAACTVLGHVFPVWLGFRGGKGVATGMGAMIGVFPVLTAAALAAAFVWIVSAKLSRYVGLSSCIAAISLPLFSWAALHLLALSGFFQTPRAPAWPYTLSTAVLATLVLWTHRANLARTFRGTERRIGAAASPRPHVQPPHGPSSHSPADGR